MSDNSNSPTTKTYSGDITLDGSHTTPVTLDGEGTAEDVYVLADSVDGDLRLEDVEYVYTQQPTGTDADISDTETEVRGDPRFEDGYVNNVTGDATITNVEDVFVPHNAVSGVLETAGAENVFTDSQTTPDDPSSYDVQASGWKQSKHAPKVRDGIYLTGGRGDITADDIEHGATVYIVGFSHEVRIDGGNVDIDIHIVGRDNKVSLGPYINYTFASESGKDNRVTQDSFPVDELIDTKKEDAFPLFGRNKVTWQEPATDKNRCPNCGERTDAIIERHNMDAFFLFGSAVKEYDPDSHSYQCSNCAENGGADVELDDEEYQNAVQ